MMAMPWRRQSDTMRDTRSAEKVTVGAAVDRWIGDRLQKVADIGYDGNKSKALRKLLEEC